MKKWFLIDVDDWGGVQHVDLNFIYDFTYFQTANGFFILAEFQNGKHGSWEVSREHLYRFLYAMRSVNSGLLDTIFDEAPRFIKNGKKDSEKAKVQ